MTGEELASLIRDALKAEYQSEEYPSMYDFGWFDDERFPEVKIDGWVHLDRVAARMLAMLDDTPRQES